MLNEYAKNVTYPLPKTRPSTAKIKPAAAAETSDLIKARQKQTTNGILSRLPERELNRLAVYLQPVSFTVGETVHQPGESERFIYFPETAVFSQLNILQDGRTVETAMIGSEEMTGTGAALANPSSSAPWTQTLIGGRALRIGVAIFRQELASNKFLQTAVFAHLGNYIKQISQKTVCSQHHLIEERLSTWLLMLDDRRGANKLVLTHEQIANHLGVHRPSITCIAQNLRSRKIIAYSRRQISIINRRHLLDTACECYSA